MATIRILNYDNVEGLASVEEYVDAIRDAYRQRGNGAPTEPRTTLARTDPVGSLKTYAAILPETNRMGGYMYSAGFEKQHAWFVTPLFDATTGEIRAIIDGRPMNPYKTGGVGAVGTDALARDDARTVGVIGTGKQARGQLRATVTVRDIAEVNVYSPTADHREAFATEISAELGIPVSAVSTSRAAVDGADIVVTATRASKPVFEGDALQPGTHVTAVGQYSPNTRELDAATMKRSTYVPDLAARAFQDAGAFLLALEEGEITEDHIHAELGDVVAGTKAGRESSDEITIFDSGGTALETVAAASMLLKKAEEADIGTLIDFAEPL